MFMCAAEDQKKPSAEIFLEKKIVVFLKVRMLQRCATSRTVPGSIPGGVTADFYHGTPDRTMCPEVDSVFESEYQGFLLW